MQKKCIIIIKRVTMCRVPKRRHIINKSVFFMQGVPLSPTRNPGGLDRRPYHGKHW